VMALKGGREGAVPGSFQPPKPSVSGRGVMLPTPFRDRGLVLPIPTPNPDGDVADIWTLLTSLPSRWYCTIIGWGRWQGALAILKTFGRCSECTILSRTTTCVAGTRGGGRRRRGKLHLILDDFLHRKHAQAQQADGGVETGDPPLRSSTHETKTGEEIQKLPRRCLKVPIALPLVWFLIGRAFSSGGERRGLRQGSRRGSDRCAVAETE